MPDNPFCRKNNLVLFALAARWSQCSHAGPAPLLWPSPCVQRSARPRRPRQVRILERSSGGMPDRQDALHLLQAEAVARWQTGQEEYTGRQFNRMSVGYALAAEG